MTKTLTLLPLQLLQNEDAIIAPLPKQLVERDDSVFWSVGVVLLACLVLIVVSKVINTNLFKDKIQSFLKPRNLENRTGGANWVGVFLNSNFILSCWACMILAAQLVVDELTLTLQLSLLGLTFAIYFYQQLGLIVCGVVSGEMPIIVSILKVTNNGLQIIGLLFFIIGVFWSLNESIEAELFYTFSGILLGYFVFRIFQGITLTFGKGFRWYYIILYFCTLEILPIVFAYYYMMENLGT